MASALDIRRRIKGVKSTGKITKAMQLISAVKMRKAVESALAIRPYAEGMVGVLKQVSVELKKQSSLANVFFSGKGGDTDLYVLITSNKGLCGSYNTNILRLLYALKKSRPGRNTTYIVLGKKGQQAIVRMKGNTVASFHSFISKPSVQDLRAVAKIILDEFVSGRVARVEMLWTDFVSSFKQEARSSVLLPLSEAHLTDDDTSSSVLTGEYAIEPNPSEVLSAMIPRFLEMRLYHALLESNASKESMRMMAMKNATDAAKEMAFDLTLTYNQIRQGKITQEIAELCAGMDAVKK